MAEPIYLVERRNWKPGEPPDPQVLCYARGQFAARRALIKIVMSEVRTLGGNSTQRTPYYSIDTETVRDGVVAVYAEPGRAPTLIDVCRVGRMNRGWVVTHVQVEIVPLARFGLRSVPIFDERTHASCAPGGRVADLVPPGLPCCAPARNHPASGVDTDPIPYRGVERKKHEYEPIDFLLDEIVKKATERRERRLRQEASLVAPVAPVAPPLPDSTYAIVPDSEEDRPPCSS